MRDILTKAIDRFIDGYCAREGRARIWKPPPVGFADARHPELPRLREVVLADHHLPEDFLPGATVILCYFLPFVNELGEGNAGGEMASDAWAEAYVATNRLAEEINRHLVQVVAGLGWRAASPVDTGSIPGVLRSRWSQRHIARLAGLGTFGINNMLIGALGCCGRYYSLVTDLPLEPDAVVQGENCLYRRNGACGACADKCVNGALTKEGFDRGRCRDMLEKNKARNRIAGACGKCMAGLPCAFRCPA